MLKYLNNKVLVFIATRYFSYFLQFINSLVAAYVLGPFYLGVWGFVTLILQYLNFANFGIDIALNVKLSTGNINDKETQSGYASNAFFITYMVSITYIIVALLYYFLGFSLFEKYRFTQYLLPVVFISCLNFINVLMLNIFRAYSLFTPISIFQTLLQVFQFPVFFIFKDSQLINWLLIAMIISHIISLSIYIKNLPVKISFTFSRPIVSELFKRGIALLSYALTFYILLLSTRSLVGYFYPVETLGLFTFSASIASALIVGLSSLEFVLFPKMLNRLSSDEITESVITTFKEIRYLYMASAFLVVLLGMIFYPVLLHFFKDYQSTVEVFSFLVLSQIIISAGFGYSTLIISKGKEYFLVVHGLIALLINVVSAIIMYRFFNSDYSKMALVLVITFIYYDYQVIRKGKELLKLKNSFVEVFLDLIPLTSVVSIIFIALAMITKQYTWLYLLALCSFLIFNGNGYKLLKKYASLLFKEPSVVNIKND